jgi:hypothetical protein
MITADELAALDKDSLPERAKTLDSGDIRMLVDLLTKRATR